MSILHLNLSEKATQEVLYLLEFLKEQGEEVGILDESLYKYERKLIEQGLYELENKELLTHEEVWRELLANAN
ncbi:MAG: hypothetical protein PHS10_06335 [Thiovulaceae bacterium]|nr:hypothetical protein [Sulfurimonadaceae bacterium]